MTHPEACGAQDPDPPPPSSSHDPGTREIQPAVEPAAKAWNRVEVIAALRGASARQRDAEIDQIALIAAAADVYSWIDNTAEMAAAMAGMPPAALHGERL